MSAPTSNLRNDVRLLIDVDGEKASNFRLREFENADGLAMVHPRLLLALERTRRDLRAETGENIWIIITDAVRTDADLQRLADRLGWIENGGKVARNSKHLTKFGGIAADFIAVRADDRSRVPQELAGRIARRHFDWVKDDYADGHIHGDMRSVGICR